MTGLSFLALNGVPFTVETGPPDALPSAFLVTVHKAGSVLLQRMAVDIAAAGGRPVIALHTDLFRQGILPGDCPLDALNLLDVEGYVHVGFRMPWLLSHSRLYRQRAKLLLVRDPRDIAVSFYFSVARSHSVPKGGATREAILKLRAAVGGEDPSAFVLAGKVDHIVHAMDGFRRDLDAFEGFRVVRYEDVIFDKPALAAAVAETIGVSVSTETLNEIAARHDIRPDRERPNQHVRQVAPGNYRVHLSDEAVNYLERRFRPVFERFGYAA